MKIVTAEIIIIDKKTKGKISEVSAGNFRNKLNGIKEDLNISENNTIEEILSFFIRNIKRTTIGKETFDRFNKQVNRFKDFLYETDENGNIDSFLTAIEYSRREKAYYEKTVQPALRQINVRCEEFGIEPLRFDETGRKQGKKLVY